MKQPYYLIGRGLEFNNLYEFKNKVNKVFDTGELPGLLRLMRRKNKVFKSIIS